MSKRGVNATVQIDLRDYAGDFFESLNDDEIMELCRDSGLFVLDGDQNDIDRLRDFIKQGNAGDALELLDRLLK